MSIDLWAESEMKMHTKHLGEISEMLFINDQIISVSLIGDVVKFIERLEAEVARLTAEVERLTPKEMTLEEAQKTLCDHSYGGMGWRLRGNARKHWLWGVTAEYPFVTRTLSHNEAVWIAQGLLRDAGPIIVQEPATQGEVNP